MHFALRTTKTVANRKISDDCIALKLPIQKKNNQYQGVKRTESQTSCANSVPVYNPGPKPSDLLLRFINAQTPPKASKISIIKSKLRKNIHSHSGL